MIPAARQRVRVEGRDGLFLVIWVDVDQQTADLVPLSLGDFVETVPFAWIRPLNGDSRDAPAVNISPS